MADIGDAIDQSHEALGRIVQGDAEGYHRLFAHDDGVTLGNPFGPFVRGWQTVADTASAAAGRYRDGEIIGIDLIAQHVTDDLACVVEVERFRAKIGGSDERTPVSLRVTSVFRREGDVWRLVHRHADPITSPHTPETLAEP